MDDFALFVDKQLKAQQSSKGLMLAIPVALGFLTEPKSKTENQFIGIWEDLWYQEWYSFIQPEDKTAKEKPLRKFWLP